MAARASRQAASGRPRRGPRRPPETGETTSTSSRSSAPVSLERGTAGTIRARETPRRGGPEAPTGRCSSSWQGAAPAASDVHDREALLEALDRVATWPRPPLVSDEAGVAGIGDGVGDEAVIELLRVVDLLAAGHAGHVDVADVVEVVPHVPRDVAVGDLYVVDVVDDLHAR